MNSVAMRPAIVDGTQFETVHYPDDTIILRATTHGNVQVVEYRSTDRDGPPAHYHAWDEVEYVIEGEVEFFQRGAWHHAGPGAVQLLPAGEAHSVRVPVGAARLLMITMGAPFDGFARALSTLYGSGAADLSSIVRVASEHGVRLDGDRDASVGGNAPVTGEERRGA